MHTKPLAATVAAAAILLLAGCSSATDALHGVHSESFADRADAESGWVGVTMPDWIPDDAGGIRSTATTDEQNAVIAVDGGAAPIGCEVGERLSLPFDGRYGGIEGADGLPTEVLRCGAYEVVETDGGWLGWFTATEQGQTPDDL